MRYLNLGLTHWAYLASLAVFLKLLSLTGWTWPLAGVAGLLPVAGGVLVHSSIAAARNRPK